MEIETKILSATTSPSPSPLDEVLMDQKDAEKALANQPSLATRLAIVMGEVERVPKSGFNAHFKYKFATEADIVDAVRGGLARQHVMLFHEVQLENMVSRELPGEEGRAKNVLYTVPVRFTFVCGDTGEALTLLGVGQATDTADKGIYKALTGAVKYLLLKTFLIPTGDDPEDDSKDQQQQRPDARPAATGERPPIGPTGERLSAPQLNYLLATQGQAVGLRERMAKLTPDAKQFSDLRQEDYARLLAHSATDLRP